MLVYTRVECYQKKVVEYGGYVKVYTESMAEQTTRRQHLLFVVPPGSISQLLHTLTSGESLPRLLLFPIFPPSAVRQPREEHICWGNEISKSLLFGYTAFFKSSLPTFKLIFRVNGFSIACLHSAEPLEGRINQKDNNQGPSQLRNSCKTQAETQKVMENRHKSLLFLPIAVSAPTPTSLIASFPDYRNSFFCCWNVWRRAICICKLTYEQWTSCTVP